MVGRRGSAIRNKRALKFNRRRLASLFEEYRLAVPPDSDAINAINDANGSDAAVNVIARDSENDGETIRCNQANHNKTRYLEQRLHCLQQNPKEKGNKRSL